MELVRQRDHDDVGIGMTDGGVHVRGALGDAPTVAERGTALLAPGVDDAHPIGAALSVERLRVEVTDKPGAEHRDGVMAHERTSCVSGSPPMRRVWSVYAAVTTGGRSRTPPRPFQATHPWS